MKCTAAVVGLVVACLATPALAQAGADTPRGEPLTEGAKASATAEEKGLITQEMRPRFRTYVVQQAPASVTLNSPVVVGAELPASGVTYYDVPAEYGPTQYRYTVVNKSPVLVDPGTRRIVQVIQ